MFESDSVYVFWFWFSFCFICPLFLILLRCEMFYYSIIWRMGMFELPRKACNPKLKLKLSSFPSFIIRSFWAETWNNAHTFSYLFPVFLVYTFISSAYSPRVFMCVCVWHDFSSFSFSMHVNIHKQSFFPLLLMSWTA